MVHLLPCSIIIFVKDDPLNKIERTEARKPKNIFVGLVFLTSFPNERGLRHSAKYACKLGNEAYWA